MLTTIRNHSRGTGDTRLTGCGGGLLPGTPPLFHGWLPVAFLQVRQDNGENELLFSVVIELDDNIFFCTRQDASKAELRVFDLSALGEGGFCGHNYLGLPFWSLWLHNSV
jgi:hypothetical protein